MEAAITAGDRIRAAVAVLDRAGYGALKRLEITTDALEQELEKVRLEVAGMEEDL
jgi:hypothetical protein